MRIDFLKLFYLILTWFSVIRMKLTGAHQVEGDVYFLKVVVKCFANFRGARERFTRRESL